MHALNLARTSVVRVITSCDDRVTKVIPTCAILQRCLRVSIATSGLRAPTNRVPRGIALVLQSALVRYFRGALVVFYLSLGSVATAVAASQGTEPAQTSAREASLNEGATTAEQVDEIVVTGSRIGGRSYESTEPLSVYKVDEVGDLNPQNIADGLNSMPQFLGSVRTSNPYVSPAASAPTSNGINSLSLRNLGIHETLILLDGHRVGPSNIQGTVDINLLPQELVSRVDVVTGGASAAYGSDAVAGVVNFVLDRNFEGVKGEVSRGLSNNWDNKSWKASLVAGTEFGGGRGHILADAVYYTNDGSSFNVGSASGRDWEDRNPGVISGGGVSPSRIIFPSGVVIDNGAPGGLVTSGPLKGTTFGPGGVPEVFHYGSVVGSVFQEGGDGIIGPQTLVASLDRRQIYSRVSYDVTDDFNVFASGTYAWNQTVSHAPSIPALTAGFAPTIFDDNAFLPAATKAAMASAGVTSIPLGLLIPSRPFSVPTTSKNWTVETGFNGKFGDGWSYSGYFNHNGQKLSQSIQNDPLFPNVFAAADAVVNPANGQIVCRSTLAGLSPGCVPLNPFGAGSASPGSLNYILQSNDYDTDLKSDFASFVVRQDDLYTLPAGKISAAGGIEYRHEDGAFTASPQAGAVVNCTGIRGCPASLNGNTQAFEFGSTTSYAGGVSDKEGFGEILVPILKDQPFANKLDVDAAIRLTDYSTSGTVTTWKVGANYKPVEALRFRVTRSHDIRAPQLAELYASPNVGSAQVVDKITGKAYAVTRISVGNTALAPEIGNTWTYGVVFQPSWLHNLNLSADWYDITLTGAIGQLTPQPIYDQCQSGNAQLCSLISITGANTATIVDSQLNVSTFKTNGLDLSASYGAPVGSGTLTFDLAAAYLNKFTTLVQGGVPIDSTGMIDWSTSHPKWTGTFRAGYTLGPVTAIANWRYIGSGVINPAFVVGRDTNDNSVPAVNYTDVTLEWKFRAPLTGDDTVFFTVNNLFDKAPPIIPDMAGQSSQPFVSNFNLYDSIGRSFTLGLKFRF
jgi:iron complex outermembrane recepter protein